MSRRLGEAEVSRLLTASEVQKVRPDSDLADLLMDDAQRHLVSAEQRG